MAKVMSVNAGSSSLKFQLIEMPSEKVIASGLVEKIGIQDPEFKIVVNGEKDNRHVECANHAEAVQLVLDALIEKGAVKELTEIQGVGHRIVHGGEYFSGSTVVDEDVASKVESLIPLAPLHNKAHLVGYEAFRKVLPEVGHVFVYDTAFHQSMPERSYLYALPYEYYTDLKVRRYGAHGTSHLYVSQRCIDLLGNPEHSKIVTCHLGNGCSISAVVDGKCFKTSMGFTPLGGTVMGTRCGDIDPAIVPYLMKNLEGITADDMSNIVMNKKSGLLGVSGVSSDSRYVWQAADEGNHRATLAAYMQVDSFVSIVASYIALMGGCDAIVFTAGIGENDARVRRLVVEQLGTVFGCKINNEINEAKDTRGNETDLTAEGSSMKVFLIPTNEELVIARDTYRLLKL